MLQVAKESRLTEHVIHLQAMNEADQQRRAQRWAEEIPNESAATTAALDAFDPEVRQRVVDAANIGASMNIYKVGGCVPQPCRCCCFPQHSWGSCTAPASPTKPKKGDCQALPSCQHAHKRSCCFLFWQQKGSLPTGDLITWPTHNTCVTGLCRRWRHCTSTSQQTGMEGDQSSIRRTLLCAFVQTLAARHEDEAQPQLQDNGQIVFNAYILVLYRRWQRCTRTKTSSRTCCGCPSSA